MKRSSWFNSTVAWLVYAFLYAPIAVVVVFSFNAARSGIEWQGATLDWYHRLFANEQVQSALKVSLIVAVTSTALAAVLGTTLALALEKHMRRGRELVNGLLAVPVFVPDIVLAVALLLFFGLMREWFRVFELGLTTIIAGHVTFQIPFVAMVVRARLNGMDPALEEAARDLGATPRQVFRHVTLPLLMPGIVAGAMLAFTLSLDDFVVSFFSGGPGSTTLPVYIYSSVKRGVTPEIHALSTLLMAVSVVATVGAMMLQRRDVR